MTVISARKEMVEPMAQANNMTYLQQLTDIMIPVATQLLEKHGGFNPFAAVIQEDGSPKLVAEESSISGRPGKDPIQDLVTHFQNVIRDQKYRAIAICVDTHTDTHGNSLVLHYEDQDQHSCVMHIDYTIADNAVSFGEVTRERTEGLIYGV